MKWVIGVFAAGALASCDGPKDYRGEDGELDGKLIYQHNCMVCHGETGNDGNPDAADLVHSLLDVEEMEKAVREGRGDMDPVDLSKEETTAVIEYVRGDLKKKAK